MPYTLQDIDNFLIILENEMGNVTEACKRTGISRETHYGWCRENETYKAKVDKIKEVKLDFAERCLEQHMRSENGTAATIFYLKCQGRNRGYKERDPEDTSKSTHLIDLTERVLDLIQSSKE